MPLTKDKVNLTIAITKDEDEKLQKLMDYYGQASIKKVHRSDVIRYLINRYAYLVESGHMDELVQHAEEVIKNAKGN